MGNNYIFFKGEKPMRKFTKALAAVLLFAVVVGVFAVMPAFAAPVDSDKVLDGAGVTTLVDLDAKSSIAMSNQAANTKGTKVPTFTKQSEDGKPVWVLDWKDTPAGEHAATGSFWSIDGISGIRIRDDAGANGARNPQDKDTDYFVIDLDVASDTLLPVKTYFNIRQYGGNKTFANANSLSSSSECPMFGVDTAGRFYVSNGDGGNTHYAPVESFDKYTHVTFVYDFHPVTAADGTVTITNKCYAYINGYYVGTIASFDADTVELHWIRVQQSSACSTDNSNVKFANFTIKAFETGYEGDLNTAIGKSDRPLHTISDLKYAVVGAPETPEDYKGFKVADITRVVDGEEKTIPVYDIDELHGDLLDGDVVTAYVNVASAKKAYAVKKIYDETLGEDVEPTIIWKDKNGIALGEEGALFTAPKITYVPSNTLWALFKTSDGSLYKSGSVAPLASKSSDNKWVVYDGLFQAKADASYTAKVASEALLFGDYKAYGVGASGSVAEGDTTFSDAGVSPTTSSTKYQRAVYDFTFDLNGYTFTNATLVNHWSAGYGGNVVFKNGTLVHTEAMNMFMAAGGYDKYAIFENCTMTDEGCVDNTHIDQRDYCIIFNRCDIDFNKVAIVNIKAVGDGHSAVVFDNTDYYTAVSGIHMSQVSSSNQRQGGGNIHVSFINSDAESRNVLVGSESYANGSYHTGAEFVKNEITYDINVISSDVTTYNVLVSILRSGYVPGYVHATNANNNTSEGTFKLNTSIVVLDSRVNSFALNNTNPNSSDTSLVQFKTDIRLNNSELKFYRTDTSGKITECGFAQLGYSYEVCPVTVYVGEGCTFHNVNLKRSGSSYHPVEVVLPEGVEFARTGKYGDMINYIATSDVATYTYQLGNKTPVEFTWNGAEDEIVDVTKVVSTATKAGVYHYEWSNEGNAYRATMVKDFTISAKSNLTLYDYLYFNVYLNAEQYDAIKEFATVTVKDNNGIALEAEAVEIDGIAYYKFQSKSTAAGAGDVAATVAIDVAGAYSDSITTGGNYTVLGYASNMLDNGTDETVVLIKALLNYITEAATLAGNTATADAAAALIAGETFAEVDEAGAKLDALDGVRVAVAYDESLYIGISAAEGTKLKLAYTINGNDITVNKTVGADGQIFIKIKACDFANDITITNVTTNESATMNLAGYYFALEGDAESQAMVAAIYNYAKAAAAYKASIEA